LWRLRHNTDLHYLKDNPDKGTFSSGGVDTPAHIIGELFKLKTGVRTTHVTRQIALYL
jgi:tripartite-type tricarboxylate transporter receptor subunit TctC